MLKHLKNGDWGHSKFKSYLDLDNTLDLDSIVVTGAVSICFNSDNELVLTKHKNGGYDLIGGKVEKGEHYLATLKREALEEAGIELKNWQYIGYYDITLKDNAPEKFKRKYPKNSYILFFISNGEKVTEPFGEEIESCEVFSIEELKKRKILDHEMLWEAINLVESNKVAFIKRTTTSQITKALSFLNFEK